MFEYQKNILLCSQDPLLTKGLYGPLRDSGYQVETSEHTAEAVKCVLDRLYLAVILDSRDVGLNVTEAATIIKDLNPEVFIIIIGGYGYGSGGDFSIVKSPEDVDQLVDVINTLSTLKREKQA
ncbi:MAG: hypothetical protein K8I29_03275 [Alphaproteobacteria bacterium]|uniref:Response regulatory domain-containing protein n=1 Tax=Candidatus Nitrobium versatile TaxID=2884831 RepID=A0A953M0I3_9BACT|nr:hypothetical protein [Candidatus Nitrobium versatile]